MSQHPGLQHFKEGFSKLSQRSGNKNREIKKIMLGLFAGAVPAAAHCTAHALLDFCYYAQWEQHNTNSLDAMHTALDTFHANQHIFIELGVHQDFNFQKIHSLEHYVESIYQFGATDGYSTKTSKQLHINFAKRAYLFTNQQDFTAQMTTWLVCREKLAHFKLYQAWLD
jgi:FMN-dependent NADH-azoreductase